MQRLKPSAVILGTLFGRWRRPQASRPGYTILIPVPTDMPFLLRYALEGLATLDLANCAQVVVVPDGWGDDREGMATFRTIIKEAGGPRIELAPLSPMLAYVVGQVRRKRTGHEFANWVHWAAIVEGTNRATHDHIFLHDADAFFVEPGGPERQYAECRDRGLFTLGVQARADRFFAEQGCQMPGAWEMMYSAAWARRRPPYLYKGQTRPTAHGDQTFDTMLFPQYLDYPGGKVGIMAEPPRIVHFHGTITTYRTFRDKAGRPVVDEVFRLLLLSILEELVPNQAGRIVPTPTELARGLDDPSRPVSYGTAAATRAFPTFRRQIEELCQSPTFAGERAARIQEMLRPFDEHFANHPPTPLGEDEQALVATHRQHGLG